MHFSSVTNVHFADGNQLLDVAKVNFLNDHFYLIY